MATQTNAADYAKAIQAQLKAICGATPVYALLNRNFARESSFVTWNLRNVHQAVYTGQAQSVKGIDRPIFQVSVFSQALEDGFNIANTIIQALHGYSGQFGGLNGFYVSKVDVHWLYNAYDDSTKLNAIYLDCTLDIPT